MRKWLIGVSLAVHIAIIFGLFVAGMWRIDRLDPAKHHVEIGAPPLPPVAASGSPKLAAQPFTPKRHLVHETVQPVERVAQAPVEAATTDAVGTGTGAGTGDGSGSSTTGEIGACTENCGPGSAAPPVVEVPKTPTMVPPTVLKGMRVSGETQIQPNDMLKTQLLHEGKDKLVAMFKVCVDTAGNVSSLSQLRSTGYAAYDQALLGAIHEWRYRPYSAGAVAIPVCGIVTFNYEMR
jgi:TonB family protein